MRRKTDFLIELPEVVSLLERARLLCSSRELEEVRPYLRIGKANDVTRLDVYGDMSRCTFYRTLKRLTEEAEYIRKKLITICAD